MDFSNTALIHDEILLNISNVVEKGWIAGPAFLYSLGSLIEASIIHDKVYFDPFGHTEEANGHNNTLHSQLLESDFVQQLIYEGVLHVFPSINEIKQYLKEKKSNYDLGDFTADYYHELVSFSMVTPQGDISEFRNLIDLLKQLRKPHTFFCER